MKSDPDALLAKHDQLVHSEMRKVSSHVQRESGEWFIHTLMLEDYDVPFRYKRKQRYRDLTGARINLTYYPTKIAVAGIEMEVMNVVRLRRS